MGFRRRTNSISFKLPSCTPSHLFGNLFATDFVRPTSLEPSGGRRNSMSPCSRCRTLTDLCINGFPICPDCAGCAPERQPYLVRTNNESIRASLIEKLAAASARAYEASEHFNQVIDDIPSGLPHPDGTQRIHNASRALSDARREMLEAHKRLHAFLTDEEDQARLKTLRANKRRV